MNAEHLMNDEATEIHRPFSCQVTMFLLLIPGLKSAGESGGEHEELEHQH